MYIYLIYIFLFIVILVLPYLIDINKQEKFMPKLDTLQRQKQLEETEKQRYKAEREAKWKKHNVHEKSEKQPVELNEDEKLQDILNKMQITPGMDIPIPQDFFTPISKDEQLHLNFSLV